MSCGSCGGTPNGYVRVWHHVLNGKPTEHASQAEALAAQRDAGGAGRIQQVVRRAAPK